MLTVILLSALALRGCSSNNLYWVLAWPGTFVHESLHLVIGVVFDAKPVEFSVFPTKDKSSLGFVSFANINPINCFPVSLAPLLAIPLLLWAWPHIAPIRATWQGLLTLWVVVSILAQAIPSTVDFKLCLRHPIGALCWIAVFATVYHYKLYEIVTFLA